MRRFLLGLWTFTAIVHVVFFAALRELCARVAVPAPTLVALAVTTLLVALFRGRFALVRGDRPISSARRFLELLYYTHWCAAVGATLVFVASGTLALAATGIAALASRALPSLATPVLLGSYATGLVVATYAVWFRARRARVRAVDVRVPGLPAAFDGYRIAQLSDLHIGSMMSPRVSARWIAAANALQPDLVALTGDYVTNGVLFHDEIARVLSGLRAKDAVVAVLGNHDYFGGGEPLATYLCERGIVLLRNARHTVTRGGASLEIAGVDDTWTRHADVELTLRDLDTTRPLIALTHDPSLFPDFARRGAALVLAGHTHWGQIGVPFAAERYNVARRIFRFSAGLYRDGDSVLYVNPGLGATGPPVRLGSPPEITLLVLHAA